MKRPPLAMIAAAAALILSQPVQSAPAGQAPDKAAIKILYTRIADAMKHKDLKTIQSLGTSDFKETDRSGKVYAGKQSMDEMAKHFRAIKKFNDVKMTPRKIAIKGKTATVLADFSMAAILIEGGKPHDMKVTGVTKDVLVKTAQGWRFKSVTAVSDETTIDGQRMTGDAAPAATPPAKVARPQKPSKPKN